MASTHSETENRNAGELGFRSFRTRLEGQDVVENEIVCPASPEGGDRRKCLDCMACNGGNNQKKSIVIIGHGGKAKLSAFNQFMGDE